MLLINLIVNEFRLARKSGSDFLSTLSFFLICLSICSFLLRSVLWIGFDLALCICFILAICSYLVSIEKYFSKDFEDGTLDFYLLLQRGFFSVLIAKSTSHWFMHGIPLSFLSLFLFVFYELPKNISVFLPITLMFTTLIFSFIGLLGYSLTYRIKYRGSILPTLLLPLYFPVLLISVNGMYMFLDESSRFMPIQVYTGISIISIVICIFFSYYTFKHSVD